MSDELLLALAYGVVFLALALFGVAMWKAGKEGEEE